MQQITNICAYDFQVAYVSMMAFVGATTDCNNYLHCEKWAIVEELEATAVTGSTVVMEDATLVVTPVAIMAAMDAKILAKLLDRSLPLPSWFATCRIA